jgi:hypothetical protein
MLELAIERLRKSQGRSGGWGWLPGSPATTECTALSVIALLSCRSTHPEVAPTLDRGVEWLRRAQLLDGSWPMGEQVPDGSWMTSLATLSLATPERADPAAVRGASWLLEQRSRKPSWVQRLAARVSSSATVDQDPALAAWGWTADSTAWVEPTSWALIAVRQMAPHLPTAVVQARVSAAEAMLADRMCVGGGWNYGNKRVMGEELPPYPDTTALGLLALQGRGSHAAVEPSLRRLRALLDDQKSLLVVSLSTLCFQLHNEDVRPLREEVRSRLAAAPAAVDNRTLAFAVLAMNERTPPLRVADA